MSYIDTLTRQELIELLKKTQDVLHDTTECARYWQERFAEQQQVLRQQHLDAWCIELKD